VRPEFEEAERYVRQDMSQELVAVQPSQGADESRWPVRRRDWNWCFLSGIERRLLSNDGGLSSSEGGLVSW
jgi:hypothetical protein